VAEVYRVFQIILGIILSVFILYVLIAYSGGYSGVQQSLDRATIIKNFLTDSRSVYFTGNAINFTDFGAFDFSACEVDWRQEPHIVCVTEDEEIRSESMLIPIFFNTDSEVVITRDYVDFGWWRFYYITATSRKRILFNPLETDDEVWEFMVDVVEHLPDTYGFSPKTTYGFCDGMERIENLCSGSLCEQREFSSLLTRSRSGMTFSLCTTDMNREHRLIVISRDCAPGMSDRGICITPMTNGAGKIVFLDTGAEYTFTNMADITAAVIGRTDQDMFRRTEGENFLSLNKKLFFRMMGLAAEEMAERSSLILSNLPAGSEQCITGYSDFRDSMEIITQILKLDLEDEPIAQTLATELDNAGVLWQYLINNGCEHAR